MALLTAAAPVHAQPAPTAAAVIRDDYDSLFQQMYKNPANLDVSFRFAEQAVARGDYEAAIGALERMLFFNPNLPRVKLELGVLYFKLGSYDLAKGYLEDAIKGSDVPPEIREQVQLYLADINRRLAPYEFSAFLQTGARYQTNANVGPDSTLVRALGNDAILAGQFAKAPDWNWFQIAALTYAWKLDRRGNAIETTLLGYYAQQHTFRQFNLGLIEGLIGPRIYLTKDLSIKVYAIGDAVWLGDAPYFDAPGAGGSIRTPIGEHFLLEAYVEDRQRRFHDSFNFPSSSQQTGNLLTTAINTEARFGWFRWVTRLAYDRNRTDQSIFGYNSYDRWSVDVAAPLEFVVPIAGQGHQLVVTPTAGFSYSPYKMPNGIIDPTTTRVDREKRVGGIIDFQIYRNIGWRTQLSQTWIDSSLPNYTMKNFAVAFGPVARF